MLYIKPLLHGAVQRGFGYTHKNYWEQLQVFAEHGKFSHTLPDTL